MIVFNKKCPLCRAILTWESLSPATILGINLLTLKVWAPWAFSVFWRSRGSSSRTWNTNQSHTLRWHNTTNVPCHSCEKNVVWAFQKAAGVWRWRPSICTRRCSPSPSRSPSCLPTWDKTYISCLFHVYSDFFFMSPWISIFTCRLCWLGRCWGKAWNRMLVCLSGTQWCLTHFGKPDMWNLMILKGV